MGRARGFHPPSRDRLRQSPGGQQGAGHVRSSILRLSPHRNQDWLITDDVRRLRDAISAWSAAGRRLAGATLVSSGRLDTPPTGPLDGGLRKREAWAPCRAIPRRCRRRARLRPGAVRVDPPRSLRFAPMRPPANWRVAVCAHRVGARTGPRPRWRRLLGRRTQWWVTTRVGAHIHPWRPYRFPGNGSRVWERPDGTVPLGCGLRWLLDSWRRTEFLQTSTAVRLSSRCSGRRGPVPWWAGGYTERWRPCRLLGYPDRRDRTLAPLRRGDHLCGRGDRQLARCGVAGGG